MQVDSPLFRGLSKQITQADAERIFLRRLGRIIRFSSSVIFNQSLAIITSQVIVPAVTYVAAAQLAQYIPTLSLKDWRATAILSTSYILTSRATSNVLRTITDSIVSRELPYFLKSLKNVDDIPQSLMTLVGEVWRLFNKLGVSGYATYRALREKSSSPAKFSEAILEVAQGLDRSTVNLPSAVASHAVASSLSPYIISSIEKGVNLLVGSSISLSPSSFYGYGVNTMTIGLMKMAWHLIGKRITTRGIEAITESFIYDTITPNLTKAYKQALLNGRDLSLWTQLVNSERYKQFEYQRDGVCLQLWQRIETLYQSERNPNRPNLNERIAQPPALRNIFVVVLKTFAPRLNNTQNRVQPDFKPASEKTDRDVINDAAAESKRNLGLYENLDESAPIYDSNLTASLLEKWYLEAKSRLYENFVGAKDEWHRTLMAKQYLYAINVWVDETFQGNNTNWLKEVIGVKKLPNFFQPIARRFVSPQSTYETTLASNSTNLASIYNDGENPSYIIIEDTLRTTDAASILAPLIQSNAFNVAVQDFFNTTYPIHLLDDESNHDMTVHYMVEIVGFGAQDETSSFKNLPSNMYEKFQTWLLGGKDRSIFSTHTENRLVGFYLQQEYKLLSSYTNRLYGASVDNQQLWMNQSRSTPQCNLFSKPILTTLSLRHHETSLTRLITTYYKQEIRFGIVSSYIYHQNMLVQKSVGQDETAVASQQARYQAFFESMLATHVVRPKLLLEDFYDTVEGLLELGEEYNKAKSVRLGNKTEEGVRELLKQYKNGRFDTIKHFALNEAQLYNTVSEMLRLSGLAKSSAIQRNLKQLYSAYLNNASKFKAYATLLASTLNQTFDLQSTFKRTLLQNARSFNNVQTEDEQFEYAFDCALITTQYAYMICNSITPNPGDTFETIPSVAPYDHEAWSALKFDWQSVNAEEGEKIWRIASSIGDCFYRPGDVFLFWNQYVEEFKAESSPSDFWLIDRLYEFLMTSVSPVIKKYRDASFDRSNFQPLPDFGQQQSRFEDYEFAWTSVQLVGFNELRRSPIDLLDSEFYRSKDLDHHNPLHSGGCANLYRRAHFNATWSNLSSGIDFYSLVNGAADPRIRLPFLVDALVRDKLLTERLITELKMGRIDGLLANIRSNLPTSSFIASHLKTPIENKSTSYGNWPSATQFEYTLRHFYHLFNRDGTIRAEGELNNQNAVLFNPNRLLNQKPFEALVITRPLINQNDISQALNQMWQSSQSVRQKYESALKFLLRSSFDEQVLPLGEKDYWQYALNVSAECGLDLRSTKNLPQQEIANLRRSPELFSNLKACDDATGSIKVEIEVRSDGVLYYRSFNEASIGEFGARTPTGAQKSIVWRPLRRASNLFPESVLSFFGYYEYVYSIIKNVATSNMLVRLVNGLRRLVDSIAKWLFSKKSVGNDLNRITLGDISWRRLLPIYGTVSVREYVGTVSLQNVLPLSQLLERPRLIEKILADEETSGNIAAGLGQDLANKFAQDTSLRDQAARAQSDTELFNLLGIDDAALQKYELIKAKVQQMVGGQPLSLTELIGVLRDASAGIAFLNLRGQVHSNINTDTIYVDASTSRGFVGDYGNLHSVFDTSVKTSVANGTSEEALKGSDVRDFGHMVINLIKRHPHYGNADVASRIGCQYNQVLLKNLRTPFERLLMRISPLTLGIGQTEVYKDLKVDEDLERTLGEGYISKRKFFVAPRTTSNILDSIAYIGNTAKTSFTSEGNVAESSSEYGSLECFLGIHEIYSYMQYMLEIRVAKYAPFSVGMFLHPSEWYSLTVSPKTEEDFPNLDTFAYSIATGVVVTQLAVAWGLKTIVGPIVANFLSDIAAEFSKFLTNVISLLGLENFKLLMTSAWRWTVDALNQIWRQRRKNFIPNLNNIKINSAENNMAIHNEFLNAVPSSQIEEALPSNTLGQAIHETTSLTQVAIDQDSLPNISVSAQLLEPTLSGELAQSTPEIILANTQLDNDLLTQETLTTLNREPTDADAMNVYNQNANVNEEVMDTTTSSIDTNQDLQLLERIEQELISPSPAPNFNDPTQSPPSFEVDSVADLTQVPSNTTDILIGVGFDRENNTTHSFYQSNDGTVRDVLNEPHILPSQMTDLDDTNLKNQVNATSSATTDMNHSYETSEWAGNVVLAIGGVLLGGVGVGLLFTNKRARENALNLIRANLAKLKIATATTATAAVNTINNAAQIPVPAVVQSSVDTPNVFEVNLQPLGDVVSTNEVTNGIFTESFNAETVNTLLMNAAQQSGSAAQALFDQIDWDDTFIEDNENFAFLEAARQGYA